MDLWANLFGLQTQVLFLVPSLIWFRTQTGKNSGLEDNVLTQEENEEDLNQSIYEVDLKSKHLEFGDS